MFLCISTFWRQSHSHLTWSCNNVLWQCIVQLFTIFLGGGVHIWAVIYKNQKFITKKCISLQPKPTLQIQCCLYSRVQRGWQLSDPWTLTVIGLLCKSRTLNKVQYLADEDASTVIWFQQWLSRCLNFKTASALKKKKPRGHSRCPFGWQHPLAVQPIFWDGYCSGWAIPQLI